jgi:hypothetical protein
MKKHIILELYEDLGEDPTVYKGRCLGLLTPKQFALLSGEAQSRRSLYSNATVSLKDIVASPEVADLRICMTVLRKNDEDVLSGKLFVSEPLDYLMSATYGEKSDTVSYLGKQGGYIEISEEEGK